MQIYLYINALLYVLFAGWCTFVSARTAENLGYVGRSSGGRSEYLVVYGGLQLGLAFIFWTLGRDPNYWRLGILVSVGLYAPIFIYRVITVSKYWPVPALTLADRRARDWAVGCGGHSVCQTSLIAIHKGDDFEPQKGVFDRVITNEI